MAGPQRVTATKAHHGAGAAGAGAALGLIIVHYAELPDHLGPAVGTVLDWAIPAVLSLATAWLGVYRAPANKPR